MATFEYQGYVRESDNFPPASVLVMLRKGYAHIIGNEAAAMDTAQIRKAVAEKTEGRKPTDVTRAEIEAFRAENKELVAEWHKANVELKLAEIDNGTLGVRESSGPRESTDPVGAEVRKMAKARVMELLKAKSLKFPGKDEMLDFNGTAFTGAELIQRQIDRHGEAMRKEAVKAVEAAKRARERALAASAEDNEL